jgi:hypothetical protein
MGMVAAGTILGGLFGGPFGAALGLKAGDWATKHVRSMRRQKSIDDEVEVGGEVDVVGLYKLNSVYP